MREINETLSIKFIHKKGQVKCLYIFIYFIKISLGNENLSAYLLT